MKKLTIIFFAVCTFIFTSCSIFGGSNGTVESKIVGRWKLIRISGGFAGIVLTPDSEQFHESHLIFRADLAYLSFREDTLIQKGSYTFKKEDGNTIIRYNIEKKFLPKG
jgi:hypothetical protein